MICLFQIDSKSTVPPGIVSSPRICATIRESRQSSNAGMRSRFADTFNHDADAPDYDVDVSNEVDPVRAGYAALLDWTARSACIEERHDVLELGAGTGNLTRLLWPARRIVAVDVSDAMLEIARRKVSGAVEW